MLKFTVPTKLTLLASTKLPKTSTLSKFTGRTYAIPSTPKRNAGEICLPISAPNVARVFLKKASRVVSEKPPNFTPTCQLSKNLLLLSISCALALTKVATIAATLKRVLFIKIKLKKTYS